MQGASRERGSLSSSLYMGQQLSWFVSWLVVLCFANEDEEGGSCSGQIEAGTRQQWGCDGCAHGLWTSELERIRIGVPSSLFPSSSVGLLASMPVELFLAMGWVWNIWFYRMGNCGAPAAHFRAHNGFCSTLLSHFLSLVFVLFLYFFVLIMSSMIYVGKYDFFVCLGNNSSPHRQRTSLFVHLKWLHQTGENYWIRTSWVGRVLISTIGTPTKRIDAPICVTSDMLGSPAWAQV